MARPDLRARLRGVLLATVLVAGSQAMAAAVPATDATEPARAAIRLKDFQAAHDLLLPHATAGDAEAQYLLASLRLAGLVADPDEAGARRLLQQAAEQGHARAAWSLAALLARSDPADPAARQWFAEARRLGLDVAEQAAERGSLPMLFRPDLDLPEADARLAALWRAAGSGDLATIELLASEALLVRRDEFGRDALARAAEGGQPEAVKLLLARGAAADVPDAAGTTALMLAARAGSVAALAPLLERAPQSIDVADRAGNTALMYAADSGSLPTVQRLLAGGASPARRNAQDWSALEFALMAGDDGNALQIAGLLREHGATALNHAALVTQSLSEVRRAAKQDGYAGWPDIAVAATRAEPALLQTLLQRGANANATLPDGTPVLIVAVKAGASAAVAALLDAGANGERADPAGDRALPIAARAGDADTLRVLLAHGVRADLDPALLAAVKAGRTPVVKLLIEAGAKPDVVAEEGRTGLMLAAAKSDVTAVQSLLDAGAGVDVSDDHGRTALWYAAQAGADAVVGVLRQRHASLESADGDGVTPLAAASDRGHVAVVKVLLDARVPADTRDKRGETPLLLAAGGGHAEVVGLLLAAGVQKDAQDKFGDTALMAAVRTGSADTAAVLIKAGASRRLRNREQASAADIAKARALPQLVQLLRASD